jgi:hypothetical protein
VSQSLLDIGGDPKHLGAELGGLAVLHKVGPTTQPGANNSSTTRISIASYPQAAWPRMARAGSRVGPTSSCPCASCRGAFASSTSKRLSTSMTKAG